MVTKLHRPGPSTASGGASSRRRSGWLPSLLKALIGIGGPLLLVIVFIQSQTPRPDPAPPPVALDTDPIAGEARVELVGSPDGRWVLEGGFVGYRIVEHYPRLRQPVAAAGRTEAVDAELLVEQGELVDVDIRAHLGELGSGAPRRDHAARVRYLGVDEVPTASFELEEPVGLDLRPGEPFAVSASGTLMIRGVERPVTLPVEGRWHGDRVQVVGSLPTRLTDWGVQPPDIAGFVRVEDEAVIELELWFTRP